MSEDAPEVIANDPSKQPETGQTVMFNMEGLIKNHISRKSVLKDEIAKHRDMLKDIFANDPTYRAHAEKAREAVAVRTATRNEILKRPQCADLYAKLKSLRAEQTDIEFALSDYLSEYKRISLADEIEDDSGQVYQMVTVVKLVKKI